MKIICPACNAILNIPSEAAGKVVKCPCGKQLRAPAAAAGPGGVPSPTTSSTASPTPAVGGTASTAAHLFREVLSRMPLMTCPVRPRVRPPIHFRKLHPMLRRDLPAVKTLPAHGQSPLGRIKPSPPVSIVSMILGILSLTMGCCCWLHIPFGLTGVVTGGFGIHFANQGRGERAWRLLDWLWGSSR